MYYRIIILLFCSFIALQPMQAQDARAKGYQYTVDLNDVTGDELKIELIVPEGVQSDKIKFFFPRIVPGTYHIDDFGRFVQVFTALDAKGNKLEVQRIDANTFQILNATKLKKISYYIEDTWDTYQNNRVFEPAGTNIEQDKVYLINHQGFFGYFDGHESKPFYITITRPQAFHGSTSLKKIVTKYDADVFRAENYHELVDSPIMYCRPDTSSFVVGGSIIRVSLHDKGGQLSAKRIATHLMPLIEAQRVYLGGKLPVDDYTFIMYVADVPYLSKSVGALEHMKSSVFCLMNDDIDRQLQNIRDIAAHEFFHIVTPLNLHSTEISNFNFQQPRMSKHLWLYEGVVEYMAHHVQVKSGLMTVEKFFSIMSEKIHFSKLFDNSLSFTKLSQNVLEDGYRRQYMNVYQKGALIALCLDLKLLQKSIGARNLASVLMEMGEDFGPFRAFNDDQLFDKLEALTYFDIGTFLRTYVDGNINLPIEEYMFNAGIVYKEKGMIKDISPLGGMENEGSLDINKDGQFYIKDDSRLDEFGKAKLGLKKGDILLAWNGTMLSKENIFDIMTKHVGRTREGSEIAVTVLRNGKQENLKSTVCKVWVEADHVFTLMDSGTNEEQELIRKAWLNL
jgi:predicted metalloprotease with PDZ domain